MKFNQQIILVAMACLWNFSCFASARIKGYYPSLKDGDRVVLHADPYGHPNFTGLDATFEVIVKNHAFEFTVPTQKYPVRFSLNFKDGEGKLTYTNFYLSKKLISQYLEDKDEITLKEESNALIITGKGAYKYSVIQKIQDDIKKTSNVNLFDTPQRYIKQMDSLTKVNLIFLKSSKGKISADVYMLLEASIIGAWYGQTQPMWVMDADQRKKTVESLINETFDRPFTIEEISHLNDSPIIAYDDIYTWGIYYKYLYDNCYRRSQPFQIKPYYNYIKTHFNGPLRDRLIANILFDRRTESENNVEILDDALSFMADDVFKSILLSLKEQRMMGADAYEFSLEDEKGKIHKMSDFKGKVVFIDFWFTGCGNCIRVRPYLEKLEQEFKGKPVVFLSINIDKTKQQWINGIRSGIYTTRLALNLFSGNGGVNSPTSKYYNVSGGPTLLLIDKKGKLLTSPVDPRTDNGLNITQAINRELN